MTRPQLRKNPQEIPPAVFLQEAEEEEEEEVRFEEARLAAELHPGEVPTVEVPAHLPLLLADPGQWASSR